MFPSSTPMFGDMCIKTTWGLKGDWDCKIIELHVINELHVASFNFKNSPTGQPCHSSISESWEDWLLRMTKELSCHDICHPILPHYIDIPQH